MGTWTMTAPGGGGSSGGGMQQPPLQILGRQGSSFSRTLNDAQNHLGEPLQSMNLDEFVKNIFPGDVNQDQGMGMEGYNSYASGSGIQRQMSLNMRQLVSKKTVDEVWREIQQGRQKKGLCSEDRRLGHERQPTLGEMTLEDFLMNAGVPVEDSRAKHEDNVGFVGITGPMEEVQDFSQGAQWLLPYHQIPTTDQHQQTQRNLLESYMAIRPVQHPLAVGNGPMVEPVYPDSQINVSSPTLGTPSDSNMIGRKRAFSGDMANKLVERRQKRMIKNRESAARSRARKQAYTNELESKVSRLEEDNKRLKMEKNDYSSSGPPERAYGDCSDYFL
ncbi:ABSCISIC ACID-INSENSITIVE 5-like protein 2 [Platanthera zijinensis]|uniref:ABSCISIC ACID-INSENSITIVE 5-like protein 2 n=1 Tax=Platanthera zijinensis TaxID=2320716 RepID=A0AAP0B3F3_9ASPA